MEADISKQIAELPRFSRQQLLDLWLKLYEKAAPPGIRRELMIPFLAYRIQEKAYGGLKPSTRAELRHIAQGLDKPQTSSKPKIQPTIKSGTHILRQWRGETHEVLVTDAGYEYRGTSYLSLSRISREITGSSWSGPAFFGLRKQDPSEDGSDD